MCAQSLCNSTRRAVFCRPQACRSQATPPTLRTYSARRLRGESGHSSLPLRHSRMQRSRFEQKTFLPSCGRFLHLACAKTTVSAPHAIGSRDPSTVMEPVSPLRASSAPAAGVPALSAAAGNASDESADVSEPLHTSSESPASPQFKVTALLVIDSCIAAKPCCRPAGLEAIEE